MIEFSFRKFLESYGFNSHGRPDDGWDMASARNAIPHAATAVAASYIGDPIGNALAHAERANGADARNGTHPGERAYIGQPSRKGFDPYAAQRRKLSRDGFSALDDFKDRKIEKGVNGQPWDRDYAEFKNNSGVPQIGVKIEMHLPAGRPDMNAYRAKALRRARNHPGMVKAINQGLIDFNTVEAHVDSQLADDHTLAVWVLGPKITPQAQQQQAPPVQQPQVQQPAPPPVQPVSPPVQPAP